VNDDYTPASTADTYGVVLATDTTNGVAPSVNNGFKGSNPSAAFYIALADGSKVTYTITSSTADYSSTSGATYLGTFTGVTIGAVVKFAVDGTTLTELAAAGVESGTAIANGGTMVTGVTTGYLTTTTPIVYWSSSDAAYSVTAVTGYTNAIAKTATVKCVVASGSIVFAYVDAAASTVVANLAYIPGTTYTYTKLEGSTTLYGYVAYVDGVETVLWAKAASTSGINTVLGTATIGEFFKYTLTDGYFTAAAVTTASDVKTATAITFVDSNNVVLTVGGTNTQYGYVGAKIFAVDTSGAAPVFSASSFSVAASANVYFTVDAAGTTITAAYIVS